jgi:hypothetical protein
MSRFGLLAPALLSAAVAITGVAPAQTSGHPDLRLGSRVRLSTGQFATRFEAPTQLVGTVVRITEDSLEIRLERAASVPGDSAGAGVPIGFAAITRLELYRGRRQVLVEGAALGTLVGLGIGLVAAAQVPDCSPQAWLCFDDMERASRLSLGVGGGGLAGLLIGALIKVDVWKTVPARGVRVSVGSAPGGRALVVASIPLGR